MKNVSLIYPNQAYIHKNSPFKLLSYTKLVTIIDFIGTNKKSSF